MAVVVFFVGYAIALVPEEQRISTGERVRVEMAFPASLFARLGRWQPLGDEGNWPVAARPGRLVLTLRLLGFIPVKTVNVEIVEPVEVVPGGHSIGVLLKASGAVVVGFAPIALEDGQLFSPAREAGIHLGDTIIRIEGETVVSDDQVAHLIDRQGKLGKPARVVLRRGKEVRTLVVGPVFCRQTGRYRIGLYVRDSAAGVGTLTFYTPREKLFAALGHMVVDGSSGEPIPLGDGRIVGASVQGIQQGRRGQPGEKIGLFSGTGGLSGIIQRNTRFGIFGRLERLPQASLYRIPVPVALANQVRPGPATLLTVINGEEIEEFRITIEKVMPYHKEAGRGLLVRVDDPRLLSLTGGIVQGMSGSPILQEGALVGAVTHVFIHDPTRGYGVLAEWMLAEMGLLGNGVSKNEKSWRLGLASRDFGGYVESIVPGKIYQ